MAKGVGRNLLCRQEWEPAEMECTTCRRVLPIDCFYPRRANLRPPKRKGRTTGTSSRVTQCADCGAAKTLWYHRRKRLERMTVEELAAEVNDLTAQLHMAADVMASKAGATSLSECRSPHSEPPIASAGRCQFPTTSAVAQSAATPVTPTT